MAAPLAGVCIIAYFIFHAVQGERGIVTWLQLSQQIDETRAALVLSRADERRLAHRVALLQPSSLDPDMLDERARAVLNLARPNESVTFIGTPGATD
ncbi:MAG: septum formation initiator family protein [Alphaproteobacteria bacterium]